MSNFDIYDHIPRPQLTKIFEDYAANLTNAGITPCLADFHSARQWIESVLKSYESIMKLANNKGTLQGFHNGMAMVIPSDPYYCSALQDAQKQIEFRSKMDSGS